MRTRSSTFVQVNVRRTGRWGEIQRNLSGLKLTEKRKQVKVITSFLLNYFSRGPIDQFGRSSPWRGEG